MSEELKRARREKELKHKRDKSTLGDIKEEIAKSNAKLAELETDKHQLFTEFKRVLTLDSNRRNQIQKEEASNYHNLTFGPVTTTSNTTNQKPFQGNISSASSNSIMPNSAHSSILPSSLHHLQPMQSMYFSHATAASTSSASNVLTSSSNSSTNQHRMNGRVASANMFTNSSKYNPSLSSSFDRKPVLQHVHMSPIPSIPSPVPTPVPSPFQNDRHRLSFKRTHDQVSSPSLNLQASAGGVITIPPGPGPVTSAPPSHLHYIANSHYKPPMVQPSMPPIPPGVFPQISGKL